MGQIKKGRTGEVKSEGSGVKETGCKSSFSTTHTPWDHKLTHLIVHFFLYMDREYPTTEPNLLDGCEDFEVLIDVSYYYQRT